MISRGNFSPVGSTELAEIDENLIRCNLTPAQEAAAVFRRKFIYEQLHPETKAEANASNARKTSDKLSFVPATADATGTDKRTIERAAARGEGLADDLNDIAGTSLDKGVELDALAKMPAPESKGIIEPIDRTASAIGAKFFWTRCTAQDS